MDESAPGPDRQVRFEADDKPPLPLTAALGLQFAVLSVAGVVLTPAIVVRAAGVADGYLTWAVFAAAAVSGVSTILQAVRVGRIGAGYVLLMGTSGTFIAVGVAALANGGPGLLATLVVISSLIQYLLAAKLALFRRLLTPTVTGTVVMLVAVTVFPLIFGSVTRSPTGTAAVSAPFSALATLLVIVVLALKSRGSLRLWAPVIGIVVGSAVSAGFGLYDFDRVADAAWFGLPDSGWPGFDLTFGGDFWRLLPPFIFVTLIGAVETVGDAVAIQRVSWRTPRAVDYRAVQGAVAADGTGNLLAGLAGTVPNTTYSTSISITELTGVASRRVGVAIGISFVVLAFMPKLLAVVLAVPNAVVAAYLTVLLSLLFMVGIKIVAADATDYRRGLIAGFSFWIGVGFQHQEIFPDYLRGALGGFLENGMTVGGLTAVLLTLFDEVTRARSRRMTCDLAASSLSEIREFLGRYCERNGWSPQMSHRLDAVAEESLLTLTDAETHANVEEPRTLRLTANKQDGRAVLEFVAAASKENIEDRLAVLDAQSVDRPVERDLSLQVLRHHATVVNHQQYHEVDILTVQVAVPGLNGSVEA